MLANKDKKFRELLLKNAMAELMLARQSQNTERAELLEIRVKVYQRMLEEQENVCPISFAFGAFIDGILIGVVTYGTPVSSSLRNGICGKEYSEFVLELNRLCCENSKNVASELVGKSLRLLPKPKIVVSYADIEQGHIGYVYQATNFIYTGLSAKRTDWKIKGKEHLHGATVADISRGQENRSEWMREKFGDDFYLEDRARKHRYIYFCGTKTQKEKMHNALLYPITKYPKGESKKYDAGGNVQIQKCMFLEESEND